MKTQEIIKLVCIVLILGFHAGCNSRLVNSERSKTKMVHKEDVQINNQSSELITGNRMIHFTDSSSKFFSVEIFPVDTFTFSVNDGFKGKASKIEFMATENNMQRILDSMNISSERGETIQYKLDNETNEKQIIASKEVKSYRTNWFVGLILIGTVIIILYYFHDKIRMD